MDDYEYLQEGFNPNNLRVADLKNVLTTHDVDFSMSARKAVLVDLFNTHIVPRRAELRAQYVDVAPSNSRIVDAGDSANSTMEQTTPPAPKPSRRSPARSPARPKNVATVSPSRTTRSSRRAVHASEPEVVASPVSPRRARRTRAAAANAQLLEVPDLAPPEAMSVDTPEPEAPVEPMDVDETTEAIPASPRRRRITKRVEIPVETAEDRKMGEDNKADVNVRSPRARHVMSQHFLGSNTETSFSSENPFQSASGSEQLAASPIRRGAKRSRNTETKDLEAPKSKRPASAESAPRVRNVPHLPRAPEPHHLHRSEVASSSPLRSPLVDTPFGPEAVQHAQTEPFMLEAIEDDDEILPPPSPDPVKPHSPVLEATPEPLHEYYDDLKLPAQQRSFIPDLGLMRASNEFMKELDPAFTPSPIPRQQNNGNREPADESLYVQHKVKAEPAETVDEEAAQSSTSESRSEMDTLKSELPPVKKYLPSVSSARFSQVATSYGSCLIGLLWRGLLAAVRILMFSAVVALLLSTLAAFVTTVWWYHDITANNEYCDVGFSTPPTYPEWTTTRLSSPFLTQGQELTRELIDKVWPSCVPCPENATCYPGRLVICENGFVLQESLWGLGGLIPAAPHCVPDWERQRKVEVLSERAVSILRERRAEVACSTSTSRTSPESPEIDELELRLQLLAAKSPLLSSDEFEALWDQVVRGLSEYSDVEKVRHASYTPVDSQQSLTQQHSSNKDGNSWTPRTTPDGGVPASQAWQPAVFVSHSLVMAPWTCRVRLRVVAWVLRNQRRLLEAAVVIAVALVSVVVVASNIRRSRRERELVRILVDCLISQQRKADEDPTGRTVRYVKTGDLRSKVPSKQWRHIQNIVENKHDYVRVRQLEIHGEITRVWEWVG